MSLRFITFRETVFQKRTIESAMDQRFEDGCVMDDHVGMVCECMTRSAAHTSSSTTNKHPYLDNTKPHISKALHVPAERSGLKP